MKELSIEQKAKRYDEAIETARKIHSGDGVPAPPGWTICEVIFPELTESNDEKIKKALIDFFNSGAENGKQTNGICDKDILAWLEKQGKQESTDKIEPKFHEGDWVIVSTTKGDRVVQIASVEYFKDGYPSYITTEGRWFGNGTKARLLTDKDVEFTTIPESKIQCQL